jgi:hypothetical protein
MATTVKRLQRRQLGNCLDQMSRKMVISILRLYGYRRSIVVLKGVIKLDWSNLRRRNSRQLKQLHRKSQLGCLRCFSSFWAIEHVCIAFISSCVQSRGTHYHRVLIHSQLIYSHF